MPGIVGVFDAGAAGSSERARALAQTVERMCAAMQYEPGYSVDLASALELGVCVARVGWAASRQPAMPADVPQVLLLTTGEPVLPRPEAPVAGEGAWVDGGTGARDVLRLFSRAGESGLEEVGGSFAGVLVDRRNVACLLFNDKYGMERLFLHQDGGTTYFASEAKAILAVAPRTRAFDPRGLAEFLGCGCTLETRSLFHGVEVLPGGTIVTMRPGAAPTRRAYFERSVLESLEPLPEAAFLEEFSSSLIAAVRSSVERPPAVGVSLTGGVDSRMIMACLEAPPQSVPCYTFGSRYRETYDVSVGRAVARAAGQTHTVLELGDQFLGGIRDLFARSVYTADGYLGLSGAAELYLNRQARFLAPVRMTGNWGGELMRGVRAFKFIMPKGHFLGAALAPHLRASAEAFSRPSTWRPISYALFQQLPFQGYGRYAIERSQMIMRAPFLADAVVRALYRMPTSVRDSNQCATAVIKRRPAMMAIATDMGLLGTAPPFVKFARRWSRKISFKAEYWTSHGAPDWVAGLGGSASLGRIERQFLGWHKFQHFRLWLRNELSAFARETIAQSRQGFLAEWFDMVRVDAMVDDHIAGRRNYTDEIDKLLTVALAGRTLLQEGYLAPAAAAQTRHIRMSAA